MGINIATKFERITYVDISSLLFLCPFLIGRKWEMMGDDKKFEPDHMESLSQCTGKVAQRR